MWRRLWQRVRPGGRRPAVLFDPISGAIVAFLSTEIALGAGISFTVGEALFAVATTALSVGLQMLTRPGGSPGFNTSTERTATIDTPVRPLFFGLGQLRSGPQRVFSQVAADGRYWRVLVFDCDETEGFLQIFVNNEPVTLDEDGLCTAPEKWAGKLRILEKLGNVDQAALAEMIDALPGVWTENHRLRGLTYLAVEEKPVSISAVNETWPRGPTGEEVTALRRAARLYDPRTGETAWSENAALGLLHVLRHKYGGALPLDEFELGSWRVAADLCDRAMIGPDGAVLPRYRVSGLWEVGSGADAVPTLIQTVTALLRNCNGRLYIDDDNEGLLGIVLEAPPLNADAPFTARDVLSAQMAPAQMLIDKHDVVAASFANETLGYADDTTPHYPPSVTAPQAPDALRLTFCPGRTQAYLIAKSYFQEMAGDTLAVTMNAAGMLTREADLVTFAADELPEGRYVVERYRQGASDALGWTLEMIQLPDDYAELDARAELAPETLQAAVTAKGAVIAAPAASAGSTDAAGTVRAVWDAPVAAGLSADVEWSPSGAGIWRGRQVIFDVTAQTATLDCSAAVGDVDVRLRFRQLTGGVTGWTVLAGVAPFTLLAAPSAPTLSGLPASWDLTNGAPVFTAGVGATAGEAVWKARIFADASINPPTTQRAEATATGRHNFPLSLSTGIVLAERGDTVFVMAEVENVSGVKAQSAVASIAITDTSGA